MDNAFTELTLILLVLFFVGCLSWALIVATCPHGPQKTPKSFRMEDVDTTNPEFAEELDRIISREAGIPEIYIRKS